VKPEWLEDERMALASSDARVLSIALILLADDHGAGRANQSMLAARVFPGKPRESFARALDELTRFRFVQLYEVDGQSYYQIRNWSKHQKVDRPSKRRVPEIPNTSDGLARDREDAPRARRGLAPDHDHDPIPGPSTTTTNEPTSSDSRVPCQSGLKLTPDQYRALEMSPGVPAWAVDAITAKYVTSYLGKPSERRTVEQWRSGLVTAVCSTWSDPAKRPAKPQTKRKTEDPSNMSPAQRRATEDARREAAAERAKQKPKPAPTESSHAGVMAMIGGIG
jgi:hypothetical protein